LIICHEPRLTTIVGKTIWWHSEFQAHTKSYLTIGEPLTLYLLLWSFSEQECSRNPKEPYCKQNLPKYPMGQNKMVMQVSLPKKDKNKTKKGANEESLQFHRVPMTYALWQQQQKITVIVE
jgi:hypothetical protein